MIRQMWQRFQATGRRGGSLGPQVCRDIQPGINGSIKTVAALATLLYTRATTQKPSERISRNKEAKVSNGNIFATRGSLFQSRLAVSKTTSLFLAIGLTSERIS